jgi:UDP-GlcNAc3NAcA epimerase
VEAGERCNDNSVPEEINRKFIDEVAALNFCSSSIAFKNLEGAILCGDLEYELLNNINPKISFDKFGVMTIHRQANCSEDRVSQILSFCKKIPFDIHFFVHHRTLPLLPSSVPNNIKIYEACPYSEMTENLSNCSFVITDSGSVQKTSGFFGKRTLVMRDKSEWKKTEEKGFARLSTLSDEDIAWAIGEKTDRDVGLYLNKELGLMPSEIIISNIINLNREQR